MGVVHRHRQRPLMGAALSAILLVSGLSLPVASTATAAPASYAGPCTGTDATTGVTVIIDFQDLDGNGGIPAEKVVRCAPAALDANGDPVARTGLKAMHDAGVSTEGVKRWGDAFVCRINGRPAADEDIPLASNPKYRERCIDTPPGGAYWSYWHTDGRGQDWQYSQWGVTNRNVIPGGFEGWSFSLNATAETNPKPHETPVNPGLDPDAPSVSLAMDVLSPPLVLGRSVQLSWTSSNATRLTASDDWSGDLAVPSGSRTLRPTEAGTYHYTATAISADGSSAKDTLTLRVVDPDDPGGPDEPGEPNEPGKPRHDRSAAASAAWLIGELDHDAMPAPMPVPGAESDWGLTIDALWALHAAGTGKNAAARITRQVDRHAGEYMGIDLYQDARVRNAGQTAKLLVAAIVAGKNPRSFGRVMRADGSLTNTRYDLRAETKRLIQKTGGSKGRLSDRGTGIDNTNVFSQSLAVIGLARSGGVDRSAVTYLLRQQCDAGYFRMFDRNARTCDQDGDSSDGDGTAMGIQALMTARKAGISGLDAPINRGIAWLLRAQRSNGSFGGGVSTEASNSNSTGLIAQTLAAAGEAKAYNRAKRYVQSLVVAGKRFRGTPLAGERGAIAYHREALRQAETNGIQGRDQWRRATAQAIFALAPVSFVDLGGGALHGNPKPPHGGDSQGKPAPPPGTSPDDSTVAKPSGSGGPEPAAADQSAPARLAVYLIANLVDGDHVEVVVKGKQYVDYELTADVALALRQLGDQSGAADGVTEFLLDRRSVDAYVHGVPYEKGNATYAEPLAKLILVADSSSAKEMPARATDLRTQLERLRRSDGTFVDRGTYGDRSESTARHAWVTLAATGDGAESDAAAELLAAAQCDDGTFATAMSGDCTRPDLEATALAAQALNARAVSDLSRTGVEQIADRSIATAANQIPAAWSADRAQGLVATAAAMQATTAADGRLLDASLNQPSLVSQIAAGKRAVGLDTAPTSAYLATTLQPDGGVATAADPKESDLTASISAAPGMAGSSLLSIAGDSLEPAVQLPIALPADEEAAEPAAAAPPQPSQPDQPSLGWIVAGSVAAVLALLGCFSLGRMTGRRTSTASASANERPRS